MKKLLKIRNLRFVSITLVVLMSTSVWAELPTAKQIASEMKLGWNLGNTLEATWATPGNASQILIDSVKAAGFNSVRLPCAWYHNSNKTTHIINAAYLAQVKRNVDYCIKDSMFVMINIHWDEGWLENHVTVTDSASVNAMQKAYWTQIATYFKNYDRHLLFACANEPNSQDQAVGRTVMDLYIQTFIKAVRGTGGNNSSRTLIYQGHPDYSTIPKDEIADRLMFEAHSYGYQFALQEKDDINPWGNGTDSLFCIYYWGKGNHSATDIKHNPTYDEQAEIDKFFGTTLKTRFVDKGVPVILGEYGAWKRGTLAAGADRELHNKSIEYYFYYMVSAALKNGAIPFVWDTGSLFNRTTGKLNDPVLVNGMVRAATDTIPATGITIQRIDSLAIGATTALMANVLPSNATYKTVIWTSDNSSIATVSSAGLVTGHKTGKVTISSKAGVKIATLSIVVGIPATGVTIQKIDSLAIGASATLTANVLPSNATDKTVTWSSSNTSIATVNSAGLVTGLKVGKVTISVMANGYKANLSIVVGIPATGVTIGHKIDSLAIGDTATLTANVLPSNATDKTATWSSSNTAIATVNSAGLVTGLNVGKVTITALANGYKATVSIVVGIPAKSVTVNQKIDTIRIGETKQLVATVSPSNASVKTVIWSSNLNNVATVSASGLVTALSKGSVVITATATDGYYRSSCLITVLDTLTSVKQVIKPDAIVLFPNPLSGKLLTVDLGGLKGITIIQFIEINGQTALEQTVIDNQHTQLDVNLKSGFYMVKFTNNQKTLLKKLLIN